MWVIVGLGNPGAAYADSRHNAGRMAVDALARRWRVALAPQGATRVGRGMVAGHEAVLLEPQTFMNHSGDALDAVASERFDLMAVYDDLDLPAGQVRLRHAAAAAGIAE